MKIISNISVNTDRFPVLITWDDMEADSYLVRLIRNNRSCLQEMVTGACALSVSLLEIDTYSVSVKAIKDDLVTAQGESAEFSVSALDIYTKYIDDKPILYYAKDPGAIGYRLYQEQKPRVFSGVRNFHGEGMPLEDNKAVKIRSFQAAFDESRIDRHTSAVLKPERNHFTEHGIERSADADGNAVLRAVWKYTGRADVFMIRQEENSLPVAMVYGRDKTECILPRFADCMKLMIYAMLVTPYGHQTMIKTELEFHE